MSSANPFRDALDPAINLSPNTIESNQAPSLVSDDEDDYGVPSDSDSPSSTEDSDHEEEFRHIQVQDDERAAAPSTKTTETKPRPSLAHPTPQTAPPLPRPLMQSRPSNRPMIPSFSDHRRDHKYANPSEDASNKKPANNRKPSPSSQ